MKWPRKPLLTDPIDDSGSDGWQQEMSGKHEIMQPPPVLFLLLFLGEVENEKSESKSGSNEGHWLPTGW